MKLTELFIFSQKAIAKCSRLDEDGLDSETCFGLGIVTMNWRSWRQGISSHFPAFFFTTCQTIISVPGVVLGWGKGEGTCGV